MIQDKYSFYSGNIPVNITIESKKDEFVLTYNINISQISANTELVLDKIRDELANKVKLGIADITDPKKMEFVKGKFKETIEYLIDKYFPDISDETKNFFTTYLMHKSFGLGKIELILNDKSLEEVVVNNADEPLWVYHRRHGWLKTNILLKDENLIKHYSALIGRRVGRSITMLTPLLDAHLDTGDRVNATLFPITTKGNTLTIRKFAEKPITITDMLKNRTISLSAASLIWSTVQYELSTIISGGTASGKTSLANVICSFFPPNQRIISVEDSVLPESKILYKQDGIIKRDMMGKLVDNQIKINKLELIDGTEVSENKNNIEIFSIDDNGKVKLTKPSSFIRHKVNKKVLNIKLSSGKEISVTEDHSLFGLIDNEIKEIKCSKLRIGDFIATPRKLSYKGNKVIFDISNYLNYFKDCLITGEPIKKIIEELNNKIVNKSNLQYYRRKNIIPTLLFEKYKYLISKDDKKKIYIIPKGNYRSKRINLPLTIEVDELLSCLCGMWLADGCYDKGSILISVPEKECRDKIKEFLSRFNTGYKIHSDKVTVVIHSKLLKIFFEKILKLKGNAYTKNIPLWVYNLEDNILSNLIKGYFSGDGTVKKYEISIDSSSIELLENIQTLLLRFEIPLRISRKMKKCKTYEARISTTKFLKKYKSNIGFLQDYKNKKLDLTLNRKEHDVSDIIPLSKDIYIKLKYLLEEGIKKIRITRKSFLSWHRNFINSNIGRNTLLKILSLNGLSEISLVDNIDLNKVLKLAYNDVFWDKVIEINEKEYSGCVYDISVPGGENFICNNIIAHNTRELSLPKYLHWIPMVTREPNVEGKGEVSLLDLIINSLRMRPDRIVVGEIRKKREAEVLFEAMHTGHSVYATLHANNSEEVVTRLTNPPIDISKTLLPAISMMIIMYRNRRTGIRRIMQVSEILKDSTPNIIMQYDMSQDRILNANQSIRLLPELEMQTGLSIQEINQDLKDKAEVLKWLVNKNIDDVNGIGKVVATYYTNKESLMGFIRK